MRNRAFLKVVLLGLLTFAFVPGLAGAASQGQDLTGMLASSAAERATAVSGPIISVTPASHNFGRVNSGDISPAFEFTVRNTGDATLTISALNHSNPGAGFAASIGALPRSITPGNSALLTTSFAPSGSGGRSDNVTIVSNATNGNFPVLLQGTANTAPVISPPLASDYNASAFLPFSLTAEGFDNEGDALNWSISSVPPLPVGATFGASSDSTATLNWTPDAADAGNYAVTITVGDGLASGNGSFTLHVTSTNQPPTANPNGPYNGVTGIDVVFSSAGSSAGESGQTLTYLWNFGDGATSTNANPSHAYSAPGNYIVSLTVTDNGSPVLSDVGTTLATIVNFIPITIVQPSGALAIIKTNGNGPNKFGIECLTRPITDINPATIEVSTSFPNAGTVPSVSVPAGKSIKVGDINDNLFADLDFSIRGGTIRPLLSNVPNGTLVELIFTARTSGDNVLMRGSISVTKSGGGAVSSAAAPNPFKPETNIKYTVRDVGPVSIRIFSVNGQLVRSLRENYATPGAYEVRWNGKDDAGRTAPSGIYFVSVKQGTESSTTRVVLAR